jgi:Ca2+-binding RTX toxin-like protein
MSTQSSIASSAFSAVSENEVSGNPSIADRISAPVAGGTSGWTIGYNQEDFYSNPAQAQQMLTNALVASGQFDYQNAASIATALTLAQTSSNLNLSGITDINGGSASIDNINAALSSTAGANSIYQSSLTDFTSSFNSMMSRISGNPSVEPAVQEALSDPSEGPLLNIVLADYNNQYAIGTGGPMMTLLTTGGASQNQNAVNLDTTSATSVTQSVMQMSLDSQWTSEGNGAQACSRLANDVTAAVSYDNAQGIAAPTGSMTITSAYGECVITPNSTGAIYNGTWTSGSFSGASSETNESSGADSDIFTTTTDTVNYDSGVSGQWAFDDVYSQSGNSLSFTNEISGMESVAGSIVSAEIYGVNYVGDLSNADLMLTSGASATLDGSGNSITAGANSILSLNGNDNSITSELAGSAFTLDGVSNQFNGSGDVLILAQNSLADVVGNGNVITDVSGAVDVTGSGNDLTAFAGMASITGGGNMVEANAGSSITVNSEDNNVIQDGVTGQDISVSNGSFTIPGSGAPVSGGAQYTFTVGDNGALDVGVVNASGQQTDVDLFNSEGQLTNDMQFANGKIADEIDYSNGVETGETFFNGADESDGTYALNISAQFNHSLTDPIVLDLSGSGVQLIPLANSSAYFDLFNTGYAVHTGWVGPETGILVDDAGGGPVDSITDLFGSASTDGFAALEALDVNHDGVINASDPGFANLEVWTDTNGNGVVDPGELQSLASLGIVSINLTTENVNQSVGGNEIAEIATYTKSDGTTGEIAEAYFDNSQLDSEYEGSYQLNPLVLTLPNLRGYGTLPDLYIAMSLDPTLLQMVQSFAGESVTDAANFTSQVRAILYQWAGVENVAPDSRGAYMDAQELGVLEQFSGESFVSSFTGGNDPSNWHQGEVLTDAFNQLLSAVEVRLLAQGPLASLLSGVAFNYDTDSLVGSPDLSTLVGGLANAAPAGAAQAEQYWSNVAPMIGTLCGALDLTPDAYESALQTVFSNLSLPFTAAEVVQGNVLVGNGSTDQLVTTTAGPHFFDGGSGVRYEQSDGGGDVFVFNQGYGQLEINEYDASTSPDNVLQLGAGITPDAVRVSLDSNQDIVLTLGTNGDQITLDGEATGNLAYGVNEVQFADGTAWTQSQLIAKAHNIEGTPGDETLYGTNGPDLFDGKGGGDVEIGRGGGDTFIFNAGYGYLEINEADYSSAPDNVLQLGAGINEASVTVKAAAYGLSLVLTDGIAGDQITIDGMLSNPLTDGVQQVEFADGTVWTGQQLIQMETTGTPGNDTLYGTSGPNLFDGKGGNDLEIGRGGGDTFAFNAGYGQLEIQEYDPSNAPDNTLLLGAGISESSISVTSGYWGDLVLTDGISGDQITLDGMLTSPLSGVQQVQFADGTVWTAQQLYQMETIGTPGNDTLRGTPDANVFDGKGGNDLEVGYGFDDTFVFNQGYGHLEINEEWGSATNTVLQLGEGITAADMSVTVDSNQDIVLTEGSDQIQIDRMAAPEPGSGTNWGLQQVQFADGTVWTASQILAMVSDVEGTAGDDTLYGPTGPSTFDGKGGNDVETGGGDNDTFIFNQGYGQLTINDTAQWGATNVLQLGQGITPSSVIATVDGSEDVILTIGTNGDQIKLTGMANGLGNCGVQQVQFADGTVWTASQIIATVSNFEGTSGDDTFYGTGGADYFDGHGGNDYEVGNGGDDTFVFNSGYGNLEIDEVNSERWKRTGTLLLGAGITPDSVAVEAGSNGAIVLDIGSGSDRVVLDNMTADWTWGSDGVAQVQFADGTIWTASELLAQARGPAFDGNGMVYSNSEDGELYTYFFNEGSGSLEVSPGGWGGTVTSILELGPGIDPSAITVRGTGGWFGGSLVLTDGIPGDQITLDYDLWGNALSEVRFADGTTWTGAQLLQRLDTTGTTGDDTIVGSNNAAVFDGKGGNDYVYSQGDGDTFVFDAGYGHLEIDGDPYSRGVNVLQLGSGIDESSLVVSATKAGGIVITDGIAGDQITLDLGINAGTAGVQEVEFADGTTWSHQQLLQMAMTTTGTSGADALFGGSAASIFDGKGGGDYEQGQGNGDTFVFNAGYGDLEINESSGSGATNVLQLGAGISEYGLHVTGTPSGAVEITDGYAGDQITLDDELSGGGVEQVSFADGTTWSQEQLLNHLTTNGTAGNDVLVGGEYPAIFDGKGGNDYEQGGGYGDTFIFNAGYGHLEIDEPDSSSVPNVLELGPGITESSIHVSVDSNQDVILNVGNTGDQIQIDEMAFLSGGCGVEAAFSDGTVWTQSQLIAMACNETGTSGNDTLYGVTGSPTLFDGKGGNDVEVGQGDNDTFIFNQGYGYLEIQDTYDPSDYSGAINVLQLGAGIVASAVTGTVNSSGDVVLTLDSAGDQVQIDDLRGFDVRFADGTVWTASQILATVSDIHGTSGDDTLSSPNAAAYLGIASYGNLFDGEGGDDVDDATGTNDTFVFNQGYGHLEINEQSSSGNNANDVLQLGAGISAATMTVTVDQAQDILLTEGTDQIQLDNMANSPDSYGVGQVQFADGTIWTARQLLAMAQNIRGTSGNDTLYGTSGNDTFDGEGGNDLEIGLGGSDTFIFNQGYGHLEINETNYTGGCSVLALGAGIDEAAMSVSGTDNGSIVLTDGTPGDQIVLDDALYGTDYGVQQVQFSDGVTWSEQQLLQMATTATTPAVLVNGTASSDTFDSNGRKEIEYGNGGDDTYSLQPGYAPLTIVNGMPYFNFPEGTLAVEGANPDDIWLQQVGNDLQVDIMGSTTEATIKNWFSNAYSQLGEITVSGGTSGTMTLDTQIDQLIQAMATFSSNNPGFDPTSAANPMITDPTLLAAVNTAWHQ